MNKKTTAALGVVWMLSAATALAVPVTRQGIKIKVLDAGLTVAADMIKDQIGSIKDSPMGPVDGHIGAVRIAADNVLLDATLADLALTSHDWGLSLIAGLEHVKVAIPMMNVTTRILGREVTGQCFGATVRWGRSQAVPLTIEVSAAVLDRMIKLSPVAVRHPISPLDYAVSAPHRCDAPGGTGPAMRLSVATALQSAWPLIEPTLRRRFEAMLPAASESLTTTLSPTFPISIAGVPGLPSREATLTVFPMSLQTADGSMTLIGGVEVSVNEMRTEAALLPLAAFGINPGILTDAFASIYPGGTDFIEIDEGTAPGLRDVLDIRSAASIWPDLQQIQLTKPYLRLWVRVAEAPLLGTDPIAQSVTASLPRLEMKFMIQQDGLWRDYFVMNVGVNTGITTGIVNELLNLQLAPNSTVTVTGHWADGYVPRIDIFEYDVAQFLFTTVFDYLGASGPLASVWVPTMVVGDRNVTLANPVVDEQFLSLDVVDVTPDRY